METKQNLSEVLDYEFITHLNRKAKEIYDTAVSKGWYEKPREDGTVLMLMVSELAEALEGLRHGNPPSDKIPEFSAAEEELADCIIRILDTCHFKGWRIGEAIIAKMEMNKGRAYKHGGKAF